MIIGKNNNQNLTNPNNTFNERMKAIQKNSERLERPYYHDDPNKSYDILNKNDMKKKTFAMLEERLRNGIISTEEYNRQCQKLNNRK